MSIMPALVSLFLKNLEDRFLQEKVGVREGRSRTGLHTGKDDTSGVNSMCWGALGVGLDRAKRLSLEGVGAFVRRSRSSVC